MQLGQVNPTGQNKGSTLPIHQQWNVTSVNSVPLTNVWQCSILQKGTQSMKGKFHIVLRKLLQHF
jgi:hypothetical protein